MAEVVGALAGYVDVYRTQLAASLALELQYRVASVIWLIWTVLEPVVYLTVWSAVARSAGGEIAGWGPSDFAAYFLIGVWINHLVLSQAIVWFEARIRQGEYSPKLLRPIHPIHADVADNLAYKVLTVPVLALVSLGLVIAFQPRINPSPVALAAFAPALFLAFLIRFLLGWTLSLGAFWTTRMGAINDLYVLVAIFLSGQWVPLALLPAPLQTTSWLLPFRWTVAFPIELLLGRLMPAQIILGLAMQLCWLGVALVVLRILWQLVVRRYTAVGA